MALTSNAKADQGAATTATPNTTVVASNAVQSSSSALAASQATSSAASNSAPTAISAENTLNLSSASAQDSATAAEIAPSLVRDSQEEPTARSVDAATIRYVDYLTNAVVSTSSAPADTDGNYTYTATAPTNYILLDRAHTTYRGSATGDPTVDIYVLKTETRHYTVTEIAPDGTKKTLLDLNTTIVQRKDAAGNLAWGALERNTDGSIDNGVYEHQNDLVTDTTMSGSNNQGQAYVNINSADKTWFTFVPDQFTEYTIKLSRTDSYGPDDGIGFGFQDTSHQHVYFDLFGGDDSYQSILPSTDFIIYYDPVSISYQFVDDDEGQAKVGSLITVSGDANSTVNTGLSSSSVPTNYQLAPGQALPDSVTLGITNQPVTIHLVHRHQPVSPRIVTVHYINAQTGQSMGNLAPDAQLEVFYNQDLVTGDESWDQSQGDPATPGYHVISGQWGHNTNNGGNGGTWAAGLPNNSSTILSVKIPEVTGFAAQASGDWEQGVSSPAIWANEYTWPGWVGTEGSTVVSPVANTYTDAASVYEARPNHTIYYVPTQNVKRTIHFVFADGTQAASPVTQNATSTWEGTWQSGSNQWKFNDWSGVSFDSYASPSIAGYTARETTVPAATTAASADETAGPNQGTDVTVTYTANSQTNTIEFVDDDNGGSQVGTTQTIDGVTGQILTLNLAIPHPDQYQLLPGQSLPTSYTFAATNNPIVIHLIHRTSSVEPTNPDSTMTVKRTITAELPSGNRDLSQTISLTRTGIRDNVTGRITWEPWSTGSFAAVNAPEVLGYTPSIAVVPAVAGVTSDYQDPHIVITYSANPEFNTIKFVDDENHESQVGPTQTIAGTTGQTINLYLTVPTNYQLAAGQFLPTTYTFGVDNLPLVIHLTHRQRTLANDSKTVKRTIIAQLPNGTTQDLSQTITLSRSAIKDLVTGHITYGDWSTGSFAAVTAPEVTGYTPSVSVVSAVENVTVDYADPHIVITYTANKAAKPSQSEISNASTRRDLSDVSAGSTWQGRTSFTESDLHNSASQINSKYIANQHGEQQPQSGNQLPQTGNQNNQLAVLGLLGISFASMLGFNLRKRNQNN